MKKILIFIISAMVLFPTMANAQFLVGTKSTTEKIATIRMGGINVYYESSGMYSFSLLTNNQFDDSMVFPLGKGKQQAIQTIQSFIDVLDSLKKNDSIPITTLYKQKFTIYRFEKRVVTICGDDFAGRATLSKNELEKILDVVTYDVR